MIFLVRVPTRVSPKLDELQQELARLSGAKIVERPNKAPVISRDQTFEIELKKVQYEVLVRQLIAYYNLAVVSVKP